MATPPRAPWRAATSSSTSEGLSEKAAPSCPPAAAVRGKVRGTFPPPKLERFDAPFSVSSDTLSDLLLRGPADGRRLLRHRGRGSVGQDATAGTDHRERGAAGRSAPDLVPRRHGRLLLRRPGGRRADSARDRLRDRLPARRRARDVQRAGHAGQGRARCLQGTGQPVAGDHPARGRPSRAPSVRAASPCSRA